MQINKYMFRFPQRQSDETGREKKDSKTGKGKKGGGGLDISVNHITLPLKSFSFGQSSLNFRYIGMNPISQWSSQIQ